MSLPMTIEVPMPLQRCGRGSREALRSGAEAASLPPGRVPRVARLMALALRLEALVRTGQVANYSALASLGQVTRARVSQIMNLLHLAPDIQEALLFLPPTRRGHIPLSWPIYSRSPPPWTGASNAASGENSCRPEFPPLPHRRRTHG